MEKILFLGGGLWKMEAYSLSLVGLQLQVLSHIYWPPLYSMTCNSIIQMCTCYKQNESTFVI